VLQTHGNKLTWLGHATFKITTAAGKVILVDPWVTGNPACPEPLKKLDRVDLMLLTHGHGDHAGDAIALAKQHEPQVVAIYETAVWLAGKGVAQTLPMSKGGTQRIGDVEVTMVHAIHSNSVEEDGKFLYAGEPCGYVIRLPGGLALYHAGDTGVFGDMKLIGELYRPDVACLPIGDVYTMGPREAALAVRLLGVRHLVPMHFGTFPLLTGTPERLQELTRDISGLEIHTLKPGETLG